MIKKIRIRNVDIAYEIIGEQNEDQCDYFFVITLGGRKGIIASRPLALLIVNQFSNLAIQVIIWDRRCCHHSGINFGEAPLVLEELEDLRELLLVTKKKLRQHIFIGSSSGARLAAMLTIKYPELVQSLILTPPTGGASADFLKANYFIYPARVAKEDCNLIKVGEILELCEESKQELLQKVSISEFLSSMNKSAKWMDLFKDDCILGVKDQDIIKLEPYPIMIVHSGDIQDEVHCIKTCADLAYRLKVKHIKIIPDILEQTPESLLSLVEAIKSDGFLKLRKQQKGKL